MAIVLNGSTGITDADGGTVLSTADLASQAEAEAGTDNTKLMTPLRVEQAVAQTIAEDVIGIGQTWQNVIGSRAVSTSYQNATGRPIAVSLTLDGTARSVQVSADNVTWIDVAQSSGSRTSMSFIVPASWYYRINGTTVINVWAELR